MTEIFKEETDGEVSLIEVAGQGFSASGISQSYEFDGPVTGKLYIKKEKWVTVTDNGSGWKFGKMLESLIYLASPEVAAASAIAGYIANPEKVGDK